MTTTNLTGPLRYADLELMLRGFRQDHARATMLSDLERIRAEVARDRPARIVSDYGWAPMQTPVFHAAGAAGVADALWGPPAQPEPQPWTYTRWYGDVRTQTPHTYEITDHRDEDPEMADPELPTINLMDPEWSMLAPDARSGVWSHPTLAELCNTGSRVLDRVLVAAMDEGQAEFLAHDGLRRGNVKYGDEMIYYGYYAALRRAARRVVANTGSRP